MIWTLHTAQRIIANCAYCRKRLRHGERYWWDGNRVVHSRCWEEWVRGK